MSESSGAASGGGVGFLGLLALLFIGLKLGGVINWSWWWVLAPLWGGFALIAAIALIIVLLAGVVGVGLFLFEYFSKRK